ncbi:MAG: YceI family protein, partial [Flammeovirgaceae bacterium]|nr:YceI family protein [Flammeovirgaceae bacterium]
FPEVKFAGKIVKDAKSYRLKGQFTMRDVTKEVDFDLIYKGSINTGRGMKAGFKINGTVNRFDYGLKWNRALEAGNLVVAEDVVITCNVELNMQK